MKSRRLIVIPEAHHEDRTKWHHHFGRGNPAHVRFGSKADICAAKSDVRFTPNSDRKSVFPHKVMSALPPKADMYSALAYVCFGPIADIACSEMREAANGGIVQIVIFLA